MEFKKRDINIYILSGKSNSGKSEISKYICKKYNNCISLAYASYLKIYAKNILNWDGNELNKPRDFLQQLGVELIKNKIDKNMLINRIIEDIKVYSYFYDIIVILDARFKEEIEMIKDNFSNVKVIHVYGKDNNLNLAQKNHITETALDSYNNYDYEINNNSNKNELYKKIDEILKENL